MQWLSENSGTIVVLLIVAAAVTAAVIVMIKNKRSGKNICGCSGTGKCSGSCAGCSICTDGKTGQTKRK